MNIDDRLDRLTERHEALTQSLELFVAHARDEDDKLREEIRAVSEQVGAVGEQVGAVGEQVGAVGEQVKGLIEQVKGLIEQVKAVNVAASLLVEVARSHQARIERLEQQ
jgi:chromosome segregation ATPase